MQSTAGFQVFRELSQILANSCIHCRCRPDKSFVEDVSENRVAVFVVVVVAKLLNLLFYLNCRVLKAPS